MKNENALSTERQPSAEELTEAIAQVCSYHVPNEPIELARMARQFGTAKVVAVTQDFNQLAKSENDLITGVTVSMVTIR